MADIFKTVKLTQAVAGGPLQEALVGAVSASGGAADAGKVVLLDSNGYLDPSLGASASFSTLTGGTNTTAAMVVGSGASITVSGSGIVEATQIWSVLVSSTAPTAGQALVAVNATSAQWTTVSTSDSFANITSGDNTTATMTVDTGASLSYTNSGVVNANEIGTINVAGNTPSSAGQLLISQPGNTTALWADPMVQGLYAAGTAVSGINPVLVGASQSGNLANLLLDASGYLYVDVGNTVTVSGTVAATQSGTWATASEALTGGAVPAYATYVGFESGSDIVGVSSSNPLPVNASFSGTVTTALPPDRYTSSQPINATGGYVEIVLGSVGNGGVLAIGISGTWSGTLSFQASVDGTNFVSAYVSPLAPGGSLATATTGNGQWIFNCGGLQAFRIYGTSIASGTADVWMEVGAGSNAVVITNIVQGSVSVTNFPSTQAVSGSVTAEQGSPGTLANAWPVEVTDGTNVLFTSSHPGYVNSVQDGTWTVAVSGITAGGQVIGSTDDSGTYGFNVHVTNTGGLAGTQYVEGTSIGATGTGTLAIAKNPSNDAEGLHVDASNNLLVNVNAALPAGSNLIGEVEVSNGSNVVFTASHPGVTQDVSDGAPGTATQPSTAMQVAGWDGSNLTVLSTTSNGYLNTNATVSGTFTPALTSDRTATGNITGSTQSVSISTQGAWSCIMNVTGTWSGTLTPEFLMPDGATWVSGSVYPTLPGSTAVSSITANGQWQIPVGGIQSFRLYCTSYTSGTAVVSIEVGAGGYSVAVHQGTAGNLNATVTQGPNGASPWSQNLTEVGGSSVSLGQKTSANSVPVVVASDQSSIDVILQTGGNVIGYIGYELPSGSRMSQAVINFSASGANTLIAGVSGQTVRIWRLLFNVGGSTTITISDGVTTFSGPLTFTTSGGIALDFSGDPWYTSGLSNGFVFTSGSAVQVGGTVWYTQS